jgi:hypothetical protein
MDCYLRYLSNHSAMSPKGRFRQNVTFSTPVIQNRDSSQAPAKSRVPRTPGLPGPQILGANMQSFAKVVLWIVGCLSFLVAVILALIVLDMIQHPRGVGMEWLAGPLVGFFGLAFITVGVICIRVALALKKRSVPGGYAGGSEVVGR